MSSKTHLIPAALLAAFFIASCAGSDMSPQANEARADSTMAYNAPAPQDQTMYGNVQNAEKKESGEYDLENEFKASIKADSIGKVLPTAAASLNALDSTHLFIRTADVKCKVDEVADATYRVEDAVKDLGGYISNTQLASTQTWQQQTQVSDDSVKQVSRYVVSNTLTIRVPARNLDSLLRAIVPLVQYMDYRNVTVNDITLDQLAQQLEQKRIAKYNAMLQEKVIDGNTKASNILDAAAAMLAQQEQSDNAFLESLRLKNDVAYATLSLQLYQPESAQTVMLFHEKPMEPYDEGIAERIGNAAYAGWKGFSYILSGVVLLWPLWLIAGVAFYFVRRMLRKQAKA